MSASATVRTNGHRQRAAGFYLMVLSVSMILMIIGLSALLAVRIQRRGAEGGNDLGAARLYAQSAIDLGMHWIANESTWRTSRGEGFWAIKQPIGEGMFTLEANDLGSNKLLESSADTDSVLLTGTGFKGDARYKLQVTLVSEIPALTCLEVALHAGNDLIFNSATVQCNQTISANNTVNATSSAIVSDIEAVNAINGGTYTGTQTSGIVPRTMPDTAVFDYYVTNGTMISLASIPTRGGTKIIEDAVISPESNPYGGNKNLQGIYVINCAGQTVKIRNSRVVGTLVLLDTTFSFQQSINWEPAVPNYPALLVRGIIAMDFVNDPLAESQPVGTNFNPLGTPYEGVDDTDSEDSYPSLIKGLVYASGNVSTSTGTYVTVNGVVVTGGTLSAAANLDLTYQPTFLNNPPPGFAAPVQMIVSPASWKQVVN